MSFTYVAPGDGGYGTGDYGEIEYGGGDPHANPTVEPTYPVAHTVDMGPGPTFTITWDYEQAQGVPQAKYRVRILKFDLSVTHYDTGWLTGADTSITLDLVALGQQTNWNQDLNLLIDVQSADGPAYRGRSTPFDWYEIDWGVITAAITAPVDGSSFNSPFGNQTVVWTGEPDDQGNHITHQRLRLLAADSDFQYADTGFVSWDWTIDPQQYDFFYPFVQGTHYRWALSLRNSNGVESAEAFSSWWYLGESQECAALDTVGTLYEVAINGTGYMLFDGNTDVGADIRTELLRRTRVSSVLQAPRLATTQTPFNEAIERYTFFGSADFTGGTGQQNADRSNSDASAFLDSYRINPFDKHKITLLHDNTEVLSDTHYPSPNFRGITAVTVNGYAFAITGTSELSYSPDLISWVPLAVTTDGATSTSIQDLATDGNNWYAACAADGILRSYTTDPAAVWSAVQAVLVRWAGQRLCVAYPGPGSSTPNVFSTLTDGGLEEVPGGRITMPPGSIITDVTSGDGFVWFTVQNAYGGGAVYKWDLTAATPSVAWQLPEGQFPTAVFWYQGQIMIRVNRYNALASGDTLIYTATHSAGNLVPSLLANLGDDGGWDGAGTFGANDRFVFFGWNQPHHGGPGLGAIDLSTGGYCSWLQPSSGSPTNISAIFEFKHRLCYMLGGLGLQAEDLTKYAPWGNLNTSIHDGASGVDKIIDRIMLRFDPMQNLDTIYAYITYDGGNSYANLNGGNPIAQTPGQTTASVEVGHRAQSVGIQIELDSWNGSESVSTPAVNIWQIQVHPTSKADTILTLPIDCGDYVSDLNGRPLPENGDGRGAIRARLIESLMASRVCVQDVDWFDTKIMEDFDVDDVKLIEIPAAIKEKQPGVLRLKQVALITLRKSLR